LMERVADKIKSNPQVKRIRIEGHTDDVGTPKKNLELSQSRAEAVREMLIRKGVEADRVQAVGYGNTRPLDKRKSADARAKNRPRVKLTHGGQWGWPGGLQPTSFGVTPWWERGGARAKEGPRPEPVTQPAKAEPGAGEPEIALDIDREIDLANVVTSAAKG